MIGRGQIMKCLEFHTGELGLYVESNGKPLEPCNLGNHLIKFAIWNPSRVEGVKGRWKSAKNKSGRWVGGVRDE